MLGMLLGSLIASPMAQKIAYPVAKTVDHVDDYNGVKVSDPYRWLEDADSAETKAWVEAENKITFDFLKSIPARQPILDHLTKIWNYEKFGIPVKEGGRYFITKNSGLQPQSPLYWAASLKGEQKLLIDPNTLSKDGTVALGSWDPSNNGKLLAYSISSGGSDWQEWHVRDVDTGKDLSDTLKWAKFSGASWTKDDSGFYYNAYDAPSGNELQASNKNIKLMFHKLGTPQSEDVVAYSLPEHPEWFVGGGVTEDGRFLVISVEANDTTNNRVAFKDLKDPSAGVVQLLWNADSEYGFVGNDGWTFYFTSKKNAPRGKLIKIQVDKASVNGQIDADKLAAATDEVIPQTEDTLQQVSYVGGRLIALYMHDATSLAKVFDTNGKEIRTVKLPGIGTASGFGGKMDDPETFYQYTDFTTPRTIYQFDVLNGRSKLFAKPKIAFDTKAYTSEEVFYRSKDGTRVPMFLTYKKGLKLDGNNPTILYGYGGFDIPQNPYFSVVNAIWLEMGGVYAVACLRGGGEYGKEWHEAGIKSKKQNVFDDFIAAGEWLIANKYTSTPKLACEGGSNGGLLVGAMITQRPDLFGAALPAVGVMDMLRFNKFTIGWAWQSDYGSPENPEDFKALHAYSPYHNLKPGTKYPATLITTGDHDDRVVPAHSFKFAAALQAAQAGDAPTLIRIETRAGHGGGKPTQMVIEEYADQYAFLTKVLGMQLPKNFGK